MEVTFKGEGTDHLTLLIERYEFPDIHDGYDANWLMMRITVSANGQVSTITDPALLTWEYSELAEWLRSIHDDAAEDDYITLDNTLLFYRESRADGEKVLRIMVNHKKSYVHPFKLNDFHAIADAIDSQLQKYPRRG